MKQETRSLSKLKAVNLVGIKAIDIRKAGITLTKDVRYYIENSEKLQLSEIEFNIEVC